MLTRSRTIGWDSQYQPCASYFSLGETDQSLLTFCRVETSGSIVDGGSSGGRFLDLRNKRNK